MLYRRICEGLQDRGTLVFDLSDYNVKMNKDYYQSLYLYNEKQKQEFEATGTVAGIKDVVTDILYWDFDSKNDLAKALDEATDLVQNLLNDGFDQNAIEVFFSGNKGWGVQFNVNSTITVEQFKNIVFKYGSKYETFDRVVNNPSRVIRIVNTLHPESRLYKIQLDINDFFNESVENILVKARSPQLHVPSSVSVIPAKVLYAKFKEETKKSTSTASPLDFSQKPKFLTNCRWALQNGYFKEGQRSTALLCLASTYKNMGFQEDHVYRLLKGVAELQAKVNDQERFPDEEIYNNIITQVYSDYWKNGQYSCREPGNFLHDYCQSLGQHKCDHEHDDKLKPRILTDVTDKFKDFVKNIDKNTILTGITAIDENLYLTTGTNTLVLGAPASGKTALALNILSNTSKQGIKSVFASLDMSSKRLFEKVMYRISNLHRDELYHKFQMDEEMGLIEKLKAEFGNVFFYDGSCPTVQDIRDYIMACQEKSGEKIKLVMIDYFERVTSDMSDDTASSKRVAGELQDMVNDLDICLITLVQPNKMSTQSGPDAPIYSYTAIKGSSFVYQAARQILSIWRPFCTPEHKEHDKFLQMAILKNDLGELGEFAFGWNGKQGKIFDLDDQQLDELNELLDKKEREDKEEGGF